MLVKAGRVWGKKAPHSNALKPLIEQPIAIYLLTVAGGGGAQLRGSFPTPRTSLLLACSELRPILSQEAEPVAQTGDREVCVYVEQVVLSWLLVFAGTGCVCSLLL